MNKKSKSKLNHMKTLIFLMAYLVVCLSLSSCSLNQGFPRDITGSLKPINTVEKRG